jgi:hypothetical protein
VRTQLTLCAINRQDRAFRTPKSSVFKALLLGKPNIETLARMPIKRIPVTLGAKEEIQLPKEGKECGNDLRSVSPVNAE